MAAVPNAEPQSASVTAAPATWADLEGLPEGTRAEILAGELRVSPRPLPRHGLTSIRLGRFLDGPFGFDGDPGGWWIVAEPDIELSPHDVVAPDLVGWRRERVPRLPEERPVRTRPDWICEILSPSNRRQDLGAKSQLYRRARIPYYWILDPAERTLRALHLGDQDLWLVLGAFGVGDRVAIPPFDAIELDVGRLFPPS